MLYYFLLVLSSLLFGSQFMAVKAYEKTNGKSVHASAAFSALYGLFAFFLFFAVNGFKLSYSHFSLILATLLAVVGVSCNIVGLKTLSMGDIAVYSLFMMLGGMMVPFVYGVIFLHEKIGVWNIIGLVLLVAALFLPVFERKKQKGNAFFYVLCICLFLLNGLSSTLSKIHQVDGRGVPSGDFTAMLFGVQSLLGCIVWLVTAAINKKPRKAPPALMENGVSQGKEAAPQSAENEGTPPQENAGEPKPARFSKLSPKTKKILAILLCAFAFAVLNGTATFLQVLSAKYVAATAQFPIITGGTLVFSALLGWIIFKEKLSKLKIAQIVVAFVATVLFVF